jgi:putative intracellular protease/amidase
MAGRPLLVGNEVAEALVRYAVLLAKVHSADHVVVRAVGRDGDEVEANFLLNPGIMLVADSTTSKLPEPDNADALQYLHARMQHYADYSMPDLETYHLA